MKIGLLADTHGDLPDTTRLTLASHRILVAHGTPWSDVMAVFPDSRPELFHRIAEQYHHDTDIIILGHTHTPMQARIGDLWLLNPGSIYGVTIRDSHTCALLTLPNLTLQLFNLTDGTPIELPLIEL